MALSGKYGTMDIPRIAAEEPIFILRAQDALAETVVQIYQLLAASHMLPIAADMDKLVRSFKSWPGTRKMPD
ncbi:MAG TPA: hypothetical protein VMU29_07650 [Smithella sp.]|nr:hypothetical protein [Smithella sp.]